MNAEGGGGGSPRMGMGFRRELKDGVHVLTGSFDEVSDFESLTKLTEAPLKLSLSGIQTINSLGLRRLIAFAKHLGDRAVELHECPPVFIEAVNVMPLAIGGSKHVSRVRSILMPYHCKGDHERAFVVPVSAVRLGTDVHVPKQECPTCRMEMEPDLETDLDEFFFFLNP